MTPEQFKQYSEQGYNRIPVYREIPADLDTPLSTYLKLADGPYSYLFESVQGGEKWGRYSIIGLPCERFISISGKQIQISTADNQVIDSFTHDDPLSWIADYQAQVNVPELEELPRFSGGLVGYFGYDTVRYIEPRLGDCPNPDPLGTPDILLMVSDEVVVFDNLRNTLFLIVHSDPTVAGAWDQAQSRLQTLADKLATSLQREPTESRESPVQEQDFVSGFSQQDFMQAVDAAKDYIVEGDIMQVVLSQRLSIPFTSSSLNLYRALRSLNPSPYLFYLDLDDTQIVGSSPEILVHFADDMVTVRPIAGTRPRGHTDEEDKALEEDLLADPKELAEHLMLIDLGRNDVGRIAETGSVNVTDRMIIERYSHVMHIVSNVTGKIAGGLGAIDALKATFPAGTLSGAPKIRAMEIIDELEPVKRGIYGGAIGYIDWRGDMDTAIAIRTAVIKDNTLNIQAGAGIVADSVPQNEWDETMNKGRAIFRAVAKAVSGIYR